jgi:hypothetical protein
MSMPDPTPIYRIMHVDNLRICLQRKGLPACNHTPDDGLAYKKIHNEDIQSNRRIRRIPCGPRGVIHDYVPFYFGPRSPMLYQLHTGWVAGYDEGQEPLVYAVSTAQAVADAGLGFVFSDGHGIARITKWFDDLADLDKLDWEAIYSTWWKDDLDHMDRQRRKQAEFLVHESCDWRLIQEIGVLNNRMKTRVTNILNEFAAKLRRPVHIRRPWYY